MGLAERRKKDSSHAQYMKKHNVERSTFQCICAKPVGIGMQKLIQHFASGNCRRTRQTARR
jgi:hypothetical protein